ncbi:DUF3048 domain-containing protein [Microlunatus elymi]|uniref:DUF3048 domain-containing protein n=1 Tax=Microlunatus elymi TaxID=2596828 RepID=A0A516PYY5_9ACTN|nr:DUF3048 domain-containing protein [Microlunatus elymi]QDP96393.1 DUF3048 domain-containing protein [Microlunatus elymi]
MRRTQIRAAAVGTTLLLALGAAACSGGDKTGDGATSTPSASSAAPRSASPTPTPSPTPSPTKAANYDPITGAKKSDNVVAAVKIDNVAAARPQVGLDQADMIVVERVEGNLTRMVAIYHSKFADRVEPVRSARNTDVQFLPMFGKPALVFSGANRKVLKQVRQSPYLRPVPRSRRDPARVAPHNVVVNTAEIARLPGIGKAQPIGYTFGSGAQWKSATAAAKVKIKVGVDTFGFDYTGGRYRTSWNGRANTDGASGKPVLTDNIVRLSVKSHKDTNTTSELSNVAETIGTGTVTIYSQGKQVGGTWKRTKLNGPMTLRDAHGKDIPLKPGRTWIILDG